MNMKKTWKRFFSLSRRHAEGFTLVELIVVIAILAILGGVAVPAYSGYVEKANMQADIALVSEIEHALALAGYSGALQSGYVVVNAEGARTSGGDVDAAMAAVFGTDWNKSDTMKLKYDGWNPGAYQGMSKDDAEYVYLSSYMSGGRKDVLLSDVEKMTSMAANLVSSMASSGGIMEDTTMSQLFGAEVLNAAGAKYGIGGENWTADDWDAWGAKEENKTAYSNLLVLTAADEMNKNKTDGTSMSTASNMIKEFSSYYAFAAQNPEFSAEFDVYMEELNNGSVNSVSSGKAWYDKLQAAANAQGFDTYKASDYAAIDDHAFTSILATLGNPSEEQAANIAADLNNANLFTNGVVNNMYNNYLDAVDVMVAPALAGGEMLEFDLSTGDILVLLNTANGKISTAIIPAV